jgi:hypothetical protein|uniref:hypothetical protein n=1 Tax=Roseococcus microcysteis TaxID=2771361 RepID=UPI0038CD72C9
MNAIFGSTPLTLADGALILAVGVVSFVLLEIEKLFLATVSGGNCPDGRGIRHPPAVGPSM